MFMFRTIINELQDKKIAKVIYYAILSYIRHSNSKVRIELESECEIESIDYKFHETFWGYYDKSPISSNGKYMLFHGTDYKTRFNPSSKNSIELLLMDYKEKTIIKKWIIFAYNWQQGCKPQWIDGSKFIFNNYNDKEKRYYSLMVDADTLEETIIDFPHYDSCSEYFLSLNFYRLSKFRPDYGYRNIDKMKLDNINDGIYLYDYKQKKQNLLISIDSLINNFNKRTMDLSLHKVNHIMISPSKDKFMFMHRWIHGNIKEDRLYIYEIQSKKLSLVVDTGMVSHCFWYNDNIIIGYMRGNDGRDGYYKLDILTSKLERMPETIQRFGDGHPFILNGKMLFDTYPDESRMKHLYIYDIENDFLKKIISAYEPLGYENQCRCDLHPRFINSELISIDSTHIGHRHLYLIKMK